MLRRGGIRRCTVNEHVGIMVGGPIFGLHPEYVAQVGADCAVTDGRQAPSRQNR